ncbi:discoidin domain-containing protein [Paenibacillus sp. N3.4]|uniref:discoidin domain-containing protein n=1 Tax=Paenibacillus sp. N3.4 TaxID=2603222 RepID=UPI0011C81BDC|nr:discoidin domain-containing protein [Paenibacillus sp. N3.4]TXK83817.1 hypothetical protein FU659_12075 [Paenibacillus sp. N3.4]
MTVMKDNFALHKTVTCSSESKNAMASHAIDGNVNTFWQPLGLDKKEDNRVWLTVDLGDSISFNEVVLKLASGFISAYKISYSQDNFTWLDAFQRDTSKGGISALDIALFPKVTGRYVTLEVDLFDPERDFQLIELGIYDLSSIPSGPLLDRVFITDASGEVYDQDDTVSLQVSSMATFTLKGIMTDGSEAEMANAAIFFISTCPEVVSMGEQGVLTAQKQGIAQVKGVVILDGVARENSLFIDVYEPSDRLVELWLTHSTLVMEIGQPALLKIGDTLPILHILADEGMTVNVSLLNESTGEIMLDLPEREIWAQMESMVTFSGHSAQLGRYQIQVTLLFSGKPVIYDSFYFTIVDPLHAKIGQSQIVYLDEAGKLDYVPDFKGNRVLDFSNSGYGGGGVKLPDIPPTINIEPVEGDNTEHIQHAIDRLSALPVSAKGFRGTVLLRKGVYPISGTLRINASGIVLRGEGAGEDGTLLYATGTMKRNLIEILGASGPRLLTETLTSVSDLYVPSGSREIHVEDASCFHPGDTVKVLRHGNERWIHAISMDSIRMRPVTGGTVQWLPFHLEFDRVITRIDGNCITMDAPVANALEKRWGCGAIVKYEDTTRIEHVGVEHLRVDVEYDPSITSTRIDGNEGSFSYLADEDHAINFIFMDHVKNAWMRNVSGFHLQHALVQVGRNAKWVTIQDCAVYDFISVITGGRRYPFHLMGELTLVQRAYTETARHAFAVDSRVAGPNVFLDCESKKDYNTSEPHHRWSVGCLYDNVNGRIHIQDRGWLGSGHGWSGANYVTWNTQNELVSQQPPTAQNYAIGHVGTKGKSFLPNPYDPRQRQEAYWESFGTHVNPRSLYMQQLQDRLGSEAIRNIEGDHHSPRLHDQKS